MPYFITLEAPYLLATFPELGLSPLLAAIIPSPELLSYNNDLLGSSMLCHLFTLLVGLEH